MRIENNQMFPDKNKAIKRKVEERWGLETTLLEGENEADFEEIDINQAIRINEEYNRKNNPEMHEFNE